MRKAFVLLTVVATITLSLVSVPALADDGEGYLALGDSVAFGFDPRAIPGPNNPNPIFDAMEPENFIGYPEALARMLDIDVTNASCPGEASGGFISLKSLLDNGCRPYRAAFPLHVDYTTSQLDFALAFLRKHPNTLLITINLGANDLFLLQKTCAGKPDPTACTVAGLPPLLSTLQSNLGTIYQQIRATGYRGQLVALTYYVLNYKDPLQLQAIGAINLVEAGVTKAFGGQVADGFGAFGVVAARFGGDSCAAGLLIRLTPTTCDVHPSPTGRDLLAGAIKGVVSLPVEAN